MRNALRIRKGFTLMEIVVVTIILGVLAALATPRFTVTMEKTRASEGVQLLTVLLGAQKRYELEYGAYANALGDLDVTIPASANFNAPTVALNNPIASITRGAPYGYTLSITDTGTIACAGHAICTQIRSW